jgi:hypothetical protein
MGGVIDVRYAGLFGIDSFEASDQISGVVQ